MNKTINYYNENAKRYFDSSVNANMHELYDEFFSYIPKNGTILDIGCGSGRDLKYFKEHGYAAEGLELSTELRKLAEEYSGCKVHEASIQEFKPAHKYDALWACASLLHLEEKEIFEFFIRLDEFLVSGGVLLASMKSGIATGPDEKNRYFTNFDEEFLNKIMLYNPDLELLKKWYSEDTLKRNDFRWLNFIVALR